MDLPEELVDLVKDRRIIPFVGAGFSAGLDLPTWNDLLRRIADSIDCRVPFDDIVSATAGDPLQIAEYLYLLCDKHIGPIRHALERGLNTDVDPTSSGPHVELANLNAPQVYTTNYDDLIESTYRRLELPFTTVVLPKDVALADNERTQIVKYHGDLQHESTLVLTESAYYRRLDFESPMDLKFRSDLLGRSVLFMGYSFRDMNIRIIWFKLMEMMRDIPESDRRQSYILRVLHDPVLERLYMAVGLKSIVLAPDKKSVTSAEASRLLGQFLMELAEGAQSRKGGAAQSLFLSSVVLEETDELMTRLAEMIRDRGHDDPFGLVSTSSFNMHSSQWAASSRISVEVVQALSRLVVRRIAPGNLNAVLAKLRRWNKYGLIELGVASSPELLAWLLTLNDVELVHGAIIRLIAAPGGKSSARGILGSLPIPWGLVWETPIPRNLAADIVKRLLDEYLHQASGAGRDCDLLYLADLGRRVLDDASLDLSKQERSSLEALLKAVGKLYPGLTDHVPNRSGAPQVDDLESNVDEHAFGQGVDDKVFDDVVVSGILGDAPSRRPGARFMSPQVTPSGNLARGSVSRRRPTRSGA